jgi:hypothetical protein
VRLARAGRRHLLQLSPTPHGMAWRAAGHRTGLRKEPPASAAHSLLPAPSLQVLRGPAAGGGGAARPVPAALGAAPAGRNAAVPP